jgi:hypothetical protein
MKEILDFRDFIYVLNKLPKFYKPIGSLYADDLLLSNNDDNFQQQNKKVIVVKDIPRYFDVKTNVLPKNIKYFNIEQYSGFSINFQDIKNTDDYLKSRFGNSSRYKLRRSIKKLESCFDISYKMYYGDILKEEYDFIMDEFFRLLEIRSIEKGILDNRNLKKKDYYHKLVYNYILQKKASFFIIYNGKHPIDICLNFHLDSIVYQLIRTYDINYSKFNTGYIDLIKQIEWCISNNINFINFSYGDYYWKRRWCNMVYKYDYHIFFNSKSIKSIVTAVIYRSEIKIRHVLREKKIIDKYHEIKWKIYNILNPKKGLNIEVKIIEFKKNMDIKSKIDIYSREFNFIIRPIYEFLYNFNENEKDLKVYNLMNSSNDYLIVGEQNKIILSFK